MVIDYTHNVITKWEQLKQCNLGDLGKRNTERENFFLNTHQVFTYVRSFR